MENSSDEWNVGVDETQDTASSASQEENSESESYEEGEKDGSSTEAGAVPEEEGKEETGEDGSEDGKEDLPDGEKDLLGENGEPLEGGELLEAAGSVPQVTADEIKEAVYAALEDFFTEETVLFVAVQEEEKGLDTPLEELGLTDTLLFAVLLVLLGRAICDIIGGKNRWRK